MGPRDIDQMIHFLILDSNGSGLVEVLMDGYGNRDHFEAHEVGEDRSSH